jgi:hypothetical protein
MLALSNIMDDITDEIAFCQYVHLISIPPQKQTAPCLREEGGMGFASRGKIAAA